MQLENVSNTCSSFNTVKFDTSDAHDKYLLYIQVVMLYRKCYSNVTLTDYAINLTFQELPDEKLFIDLRRGKDYTGELEKINRDDSDLRITVQQGSGIGSRLLTLAKKAAKAPITQKIGKMALNELLANSLVDMMQNMVDKNFDKSFLMAEKQKKFC